jgi:hypothetical protein
MSEESLLDPKLRAGEQEINVLRPPPERRLVKEVRLPASLDRA